MKSLIYCNKCTLFVACIQPNLSCRSINMIASPQSPLPFPRPLPPRNYQFHIWDTVNTNLADDEAYSPTVPGVYTWPLEGETGYYKTLHAGPLPPLECSSNAPFGTVFAGCFQDSSNNRLLDSDSMTLEEMGPDGMTNQVTKWPEGVRVRLPSTCHAIIRPNRTLMF